MGYVNLTKAKVGQSLLVKTKEDMAGYKAGDAITGNLKVAGDENGSLLILLNISKK